MHPLSNVLLLLIAIFVSLFFNEKIYNSLARFSKLFNYSYLLTIHNRT